MYKLPERRGGGGEVIWAMPERKHLFLKEGFPYAAKKLNEKNFGHITKLASHNLGGLENSV